ncbi:MAG: hypothetical protein ACRDKI_05515 [Solirubrobacterales bacterium]
MRAQGLIAMTLACVALACCAGNAAAASSVDTGGTHIEVTTDLSALTPAYGYVNETVTVRTGASRSARR